MQNVKCYCLDGAIGDIQGLGEGGLQQKNVALVVPLYVTHLTLKTGSHWIPSHTEGLNLSQWRSEGHSHTEGAWFMDYLSVLPVIDYNISRLSMLQNCFPNWHQANNWNCSHLSSLVYSPSWLWTAVLCGCSVVAFSFAEVTGNTSSELHRPIPQYFRGSRQ